MISRAEAEEKARECLTQFDKDVPGGVEIMINNTIERPYGWIFFYNSKRFIQTGEIFEALGGNSPIFIDAQDGTLRLLGTALPTEESLRMLDVEYGCINETRRSQ